MNEVGLKDQCFGVEVELTGITREQAAQALADYLGTEPRRGDDYYDSWYVRDGEGKEWRLMSDSSIRGEQKVGARYTSTSDPRYRVENGHAQTDLCGIAQISGMRPPCPHRRRKSQFLLRYPYPCGCCKPQPAVAKKSHRDHVFQRGYFVQGIAGQ